MWLGLALISGALAHSPHDVASVLSRAPDGTLVTNDSDLLARSTDNGNSFQYRYWSDGIAACVFALDAETWVVGGKNTGGWRTDDGGLSFQSTGGPPSVTACAHSDSGMVIAGLGGSWWSQDGQSWEALGDSVSWLAQDLTYLESGTLIAVDDSGLAWRLDSLESSVWQALEEAGFLVIRALDTDGQSLVAGRSGDEMAISTDGGLSWEALDGSPWNVRVLTLSEDTWLAASADEAVWVGTDQGRSWSLDAEGLDELAEGAGGPGDGIHYFHLLIEDTGWVLGSFEGLYFKQPQDSHWSQAELDTIPRVRSATWLEDGELLLGAYGGGVYRGRPGDDDWREVSKGIGWSFPKQVLAADPGGDELWVVSGSALFHSLDAGATWDSAPVLLSEAGDMVALHPDYPETAHVAVGGRVLNGQGAVAASLDGGVSWAVVELPGTCMAKPRALAWGDELHVACGTNGGLYASSDSGLSFSASGEVGAEVHEILPGSPSLLASDAGIWSWSESGELTSLALPETPVTAIARDPDARIWAGSPLDGLVRVDSSGEVEWLGWPDGDYIEDLAISESGAVVVALRTGAWWSHDEGLSFERACDYDRIDDRLQHWWMDGFGLEVLEEASTGYVHLGVEGAVAHLRFTGSQIRLHGAPTAGTRIQVEIDGEYREDLCWSDGLRPGFLWGEDLTPGAHELIVEVVSGTLRLDGAERWQDLQPDFPEPATSDTGTETRCSCSESTDTAWFLFPGLLWTWRRRTRIHSSR